MPHYMKMFENNYVGAWDLTDDQDRPIDKTVLIERVEAQVIKSQRGEAKKPVLWFKGVNRPMVVNKTNARVIATLYGPRVEDWAGKRITLYQATTNTSDGEVLCVRVRPKEPAAAKKNGQLEQLEPGAEG
jgi:hypothetical protein